MNIKIKEAIQRAKTCCPSKCEVEATCFTLATEVERLSALLEQLTSSQLGYENTLPFWEKVL